MKTHKHITALMVLAMSLSAGAINAQGSGLMGKVGEGFLKVVQQVGAPGSTQIPAAGEIEFAFSPHKGAEDLVLKVIRSAKSEVIVAAYAFTSAPVTQALLDAKKRGVKVSVLADHKHNLSRDESGKAQAALGALTNAGVATRSIAVYPIHHDKFIIVDRRHVQLGSFNYTAAAAKSNSEYVVANWNNPQLADGFLRHFEANWAKGKPIELKY